MTGGLEAVLPGVKGAVFDNYWLLLWLGSLVLPLWLWLWLGPLILPGVEGVVGCF